MKTIKLKKMVLENFKGIKQLEIDFAQTTNIFGANASGKTTVVDGFIWLMFDKDSTGRKNFEIKTLDANNEPIHRQEHIVTATIEVDGRMMVLKKVYKEKWTKKRGSTEAEFSGHTTDTYIDEVPYTQKDYQIKIEELLAEEVFKAITNPLYFNQLPWKEQRNLILTLAGEPTFDDMVSANAEFEEFRQELEYKSTDEIKSMLANQKKKLSQDIKDIPARIDEVKKSIANDSELPTKEKNDAEIARVSDIVNNYNKYHAELKSRQQELTTLQKTVFEAEQEHIKNQNQLKIATNSGNNEEMTKTEINLNNAKSRLSVAREGIKYNQTQIDDANKEKKRLFEEFNQVKLKKFELNENALNCPTCGTKLENASDVKTEQEKHFNEHKAKQLEEIDKKGRKYKKFIENINEDSAEREKECIELAKQIEGLELQLHVLKNKKVEEFVETPFQVDATMTKEIEKVQKAIAEFQDADTQRAKYLEELQSLNAQAIQILQNAKAEERVNELIAEESAKANEIAEIERRQDLLTQFIVTKIEMIQKNVDKHFAITTFKMFNENINGGIEETCIALNDGVPFNDLNNAMRVNVGLDIINALQKHYETLAPIFIDNRESVSRILKTDAQVINLIVSSKYKKLKIEGKE